MSPLLHSEVERVRHSRCPREFGAVVADIEARLGREVAVGDFDEVVRGHHGQTAPHKTATYVRQLPGGGGAQLWRLTPGVETVSRDVFEYVSIQLREAYASSPLRIAISPATACGGVIGDDKLLLQPVVTTDLREALRSLGYVVVEQAEGAVA